MSADPIDDVWACEVTAGGLVPIPPCEPETEIELSKALAIAKECMNTEVRKVLIIAAQSTNESVRLICEERARIFTLARKRIESHEISLCNGKS